MANLVDKCKSEMAKLRQKGQTLFSNGSGDSGDANAARCSEGLQTKDGISTGLGSAFGRVMRVNSPASLYSDASVFMIVECISP